MNLKKAKTIVKAFLEELPVEEKWYQDRIEICNGCEYNSKNMSKDTLKIADKIKISTGICDNGNHCTACGCCIERKCSVKQETCGKASIGLNPNWVALEVESLADKNLSIINVTDSMGSVYLDGTTLVYELNPTSSPKVSFSFQLKRKGGLDVKSYNAGCSCTVGSIDVIDEETSQFNVDISTLKFSENTWTQKNMYVTYNLGINTKTITILFKIYKNGN